MFWASNFSADAKVKMKKRATGQITKSPKNEETSDMIRQMRDR